MSRADITVVVCTYNRAEMLRGALNSLMCQDAGGEFGYEIVVVDDASTDATPEVVREAAERSPVPMRCVKGQGKGIACARNSGIAESRAEWIAFFDDDQTAEPDWLKELYAVALKNGSGCVGGAISLALTAPELSRLSPVSRAILGEVWRGSEVRKCGRKEYPGTGNVLVNRSVFDQVGQFDESLTRGGEDTEFVSRLRRAELPAWFTPRAVVHHYVPAYRLREGYLFWRSLRVGDNYACGDFTEWGLPRTVIACFARIAQASLINLPLMSLAYVTGNRVEAVGRRCLVWRAWAYLRTSLRLISPRLFPQEAYFSHLSMRGEQDAFASGSKSRD
jgi:glycosyltransferase involved in cell wall biosynthesis